MDAQVRGIKPTFIPRYLIILIVTLIVVMGTSCIVEKKKTTLKVNPIKNGSTQIVEISTIGGSLQNGAWSPDNKEILFTNFLGGYNGSSTNSTSNLIIHDLANGTSRTLVSDSEANVNLPGSTWNSISQQIVFSSDKINGLDQIFTINADGSNPRQITARTTNVAYEPSLSPDGQWVVFESHLLNESGNGIIMKYRVDGTSLYLPLTAVTDDCRQPNWSPDNKHIVYQRLVGDEATGQWDLWIMDIDGSNKIKITDGSGSKTDASFSPDGEWIVYSADDHGRLPFANLFVKNITNGQRLQITDYNGYNGAPSWSPDGNKIIYESFPGDPDNQSGTTLWIVDFTQPKN